MKKICVVTGSRAEYGLLTPLIREFHRDESIQLQIAVTGMHLSSEHGLTYRQIEEDGYRIDEKIEVVLSSDSHIATAKSIGLGVIGFADAFSRLTPDMVVVLGDRYEIFAAVCAAYVSRIPISHIHGGETTAGAYDEGFRHAITKMSYLHFASTEDYRDRIIRMGEDPERVWNVGSLGVEICRKTEFLTLAELMDVLGLVFDNNLAVVVFHPVTLEDNTSEQCFKEVLKALEGFPELRLLFIKANSDSGGRAINALINVYVAANGDKAVAFDSLPQRVFLSALKHARVLIGNSSSGIIEAPSLGVPTVNVGDRQKSRVHAQTVIHSGANGR